MRFCNILQLQNEHLYHKKTCYKKDIAKIKSHLSLRVAVCGVQHNRSEERRAWSDTVAFPLHFIYRGTRKISFEAREAALYRALLRLFSTATIISA